MITDRIRLIVMCGLGAAAIGMVGWATVSVYNHFSEFEDRADRIKSLEGDLDTRTDERDEARAEIDRLAGVIESNRAAHERQIAAIQASAAIARQEAAEARAAADRYRRIRDAATSTPEADRQPVSPVVRDALSGVLRQPDPGA